MTSRRSTSPVALVAAVTAAVAGVGVPVHGHALNHDHLAPHIERAHHAHDAHYAQGDDRLTTQGAKLVAAALASSPERIAVPATKIAPAPLDFASPGGRHPPRRAARAPPA
ncbi:MAG TPA: hypothetical protein VM737_09690 [Gemmatimonadota bacterium]|nr:hypothetical protein [Gemmatimonadota bacterium]